MVSGRFANHLLLDCLCCQLPLTLLAAIAIWLFCWAGSSNLGAGSLIRSQQLNSLVHLPWTTFKLNCFCVLYFFFPFTVSPSRSGSWAITWGHSLLLFPASDESSCPFVSLLHYPSQPHALYLLLKRLACPPWTSWCTTRTVPGPDEWFSIRSILCHLGHLRRQCHKDTPISHTLEGKICTALSLC